MHTNVALVLISPIFFFFFDFIIRLKQKKENGFLKEKIKLCTGRSGGWSLWLGRGIVCNVHYGLFLNIIILLFSTSALA